ncbi:MAG: glucosyl-3-phosphoglycerate synthase [Acidimicrobiia bacterium]|nr:glucosyl-3-phosphoglycerate synthase [Acidimicrobiia bacterium]
MSSVHTFHHSDFPVARLRDAKDDRRISLVLPARDEAATVGGIVSRVRRDLVDTDALLDEVIVVDSGSTDATARVAADAGATVVDAAELFPELGPALGKGDAMWRSLSAAKGDVIAWVDADIEDFDSRMVTGVLGPVLSDDRVVLAKGFYRRPIVEADGSVTPSGGGRVTELVGRPLISLLFPALAGFVQPLAGEYAVRRDAVEAVPFAVGYGVEVGLLVDLWRRHGIDALAQVDLEERGHRHRPRRQLGLAAFEVQHALLRRAAPGLDLATSLGVAVAADGHVDHVAAQVGERPPVRGA